ncbi:MAG: helix-turn-helix transcriptional regulator [Defluviitaleaceae bacterium]|nr:helix-turn-helix transcriptional regulator [Defluviitaleaceae bacterium]
MAQEKVESELVAKIRSLCKEHGISMRRLERDNEFGNGLVSKWSHSSPSVAYLQKVAQYFGVSINYLLGEKEFEETGSKYVFPHNIIAEARVAYSVENEKVRTKATHQKLDIQQMLKYLIKVTNDGSKEILYKGRPLTRQEMRELKTTLKQTMEACKVFDKKQIRK